MEDEKQGEAHFINDQGNVDKVTVLSSTLPDKWTETAAEALGCVLNQANQTMVQAR